MRRYGSRGWSRRGLEAELHDTEARKKIRGPRREGSALPYFGGQGVSCTSGACRNGEAELPHTARPYGGDRQRVRRMRPLPSRSQSMETLSLRASVMRKSVWGVVPLS